MSGLPAASLADRVLDAANVCCERWGYDRATIDDISAEAGVSRATLYRLFPGGREVLLDAMRERNVRRFLDELDAHLADADTLEDLVIGIVSHATLQLRNDAHLQFMLASEPGAVARDLGVESLPRIVSTATLVFGPRFAPFLSDDGAADLAEWVSRLVVSYFLAPSPSTDLADPDQAAAFVRRFVLPAFAIPAT